MSEALSSDIQKPIEQSNENLSKAVEQLSLTIDDSNEPSTPPKNLSDMPFDVVGLIIERSDYKEQLVLQKTSKSLRELVDKQSPSCKRLKVSCKLDCIICSYNDHCVAYVSPNWDQDDSWSKYKDYRINTIIWNTDYEEVAFDDLASTLKNPKLQLEYFSFDTEKFDSYEKYMSAICQYEDNKNWEFHNKFERVQKKLKSINHQLSVKACGFNTPNHSNAMSMLSVLKEGILEKITFATEPSHGSEAMRKIALLEQWKQAKELELECLFSLRFLTEHATHFKRFQFDIGYVGPGALVLIRDVRLFKIKKRVTLYFSIGISEHENAELCSILGYYRKMNDFQGVVGRKVSPNSSHYSIPNSDDCLKFKFTNNDHITIEKKKKQLNK